MSTEIEIKACEVCDGSELISVLDLGSHPMCDDLVPNNDLRVCKEYPIEIMYCKTCNTAHQRYQIPKAELFPLTYHYRSRFTADVLNGMKNLVLRTEEVFGPLKDKTVIDIGCNDGSLLDFFRAQGAITVGVEPTGAYSDAGERGHILLNSFFTEQVADLLLKEYGSPDFICFTNVFAHIEDLKSVIKALNVLSSANTKIIIENHYLGSVLNGNQFDTFYHEHPRTYSFQSFTFIAEALGKEIVNVDFPARYGGNIRIFIGGRDFMGKRNYDNTEVVKLEQEFAALFKKMKGGIELWKKRKKKQISSYVKMNGKIKAKAFPGRAAILIKLLGLDESLISAVYEKPGSMKIGHLVPGTRIPILSDLELFAEQKVNESVLNLAWHISPEIEAYLRKNGFRGDIINILDKSDFLE
jgi:hypothetical protein